MLLPVQVARSSAVGPKPARQKRRSTCAWRHRDLAASGGRGDQAVAAGLLRKDLLALAPGAAGWAGPSWGPSCSWPPRPAGDRSTCTSRPGACGTRPRTAGSGRTRKSPVGSLTSYQTTPRRAGKAACRPASCGDPGAPCRRPWPWSRSRRSRTACPGRAPATVAYASPNSRPGSLHASVGGLAEVVGAGADLVDLLRPREVRRRARWPACPARSARRASRGT